MNYFLNLLLIGEKCTKVVAASPPSRIPVVEMVTPRGVTVWTQMHPERTTWPAEHWARS